MASFAFVAMMKADHAHWRPCMIQQGHLINLKIFLIIYLAASLNCDLVGIEPRTANRTSSLTTAMQDPKGSFAQSNSLQLNI
jgi:hypothetical protein